MSTDKMREALVMARAGLVSYQENCPQTFSECDSEALDQIDAALSQSEPEVSQEPIAVMWQHEETGNTGFVDMYQVENRFFKHNPGLKQVCFCYSSSPDYEALARIDAEKIKELHLKVIDATITEVLESNWICSDTFEEIRAGVRINKILEKLK